MSRFARHVVRDVISLDGIWDFAYLGDTDPDLVDPQTIIFADHMAVPGCFDATPAFAGKRGLAAYRIQPMVVEAVPYRLVFQSVHHWCRVFVNGQALKDHAGGFGRFQVDLPVQLPGLLDLVVLVDNRFHNERSPLHMDHFDWYQYGGISRPVELHKLGNLWMENVRVVTERIDLPTLRVFFDYRTVQPGSSADFQISVDGQVLIHERIDLARTSGRIDRLLELAGAALWLPETPNLHLVEIRLGEDDWRMRVGLRQVKVVGRQILINDLPVRLVGFNRHEYHPQFGHALPDALIVADVQLLLDLGCNFVRGSHYPQDERFLDLCDEAGICVWDEGIGWQYKAEHLMDERFQAAQQTNLEEMVSVAQTHPSVILYGILNESQSSDPAARRVYARLFGRLRELDSSRPVTYATHLVLEDLCLDLADVISVNCYPGWYHSEIEDIPDYLDKVVEHLGGIGLSAKPLILSEIGAAAVPGWRDWNEDRWSEQYQARLLETVIRYLFLERDRFIGLSIWQFCDVRSGETPAGMMNRARGYNNKGVLDEYRRPKMAYHVVKELFHQLG